MEGLDHLYIGYFPLCLFPYNTRQPTIATLRCSLFTMNVNFNFDSQRGWVLIVGLLILALMYMIYRDMKREGSRWLPGAVLIRFREYIRNIESQHQVCARTMEMGSRIKFEVVTSTTLL